MTLQIKVVLQSLKNPLIVASLILGIIGAPFLWFSGTYLGRGQEVLGAVLFIIYVVICTIDALVTLTLLTRR